MQRVNSNVHRAIGISFLSFVLNPLRKYRRNDNVIVIEIKTQILMLGPNWQLNALEIDFTMNTST